MLQKFKITTCAFILCLFGLTLITASPVFADDSIDFVECQQIKPNKTSYALMKEKKNCFRDLALSNHALIDGLVSRMLSLEPDARQRGFLQQVTPEKTKKEMKALKRNCQKIKPNKTSYALMKEKKNCFRDIARQTLMTIGFVVIEIEEQIERYEAKQRAENPTVLKGSNVAQKPQMLVATAICITDEECTRVSAEKVATGVKRAMNWVCAMFGGKRCGR